MIILKEPYGQTSNQFIQHIHLDSFCRDHGIVFYNKFILALENDYPNLKSVYKYKTVYNLLHFINTLKLTKHLNIHFKDLEQIDYYRTRILDSKLLFCRGWYFRSWETTLKYRSYYQELFKPNIDKSLKEMAWMADRTGVEKIIGVHVRRGDYKFFQGGIYYYDDKVYIDKIRQLHAALGGDSKIMIFTDDKNLNTAVYKASFKNIMISNNPVKVDHYLMSRCDYIIGPPSTFSLWASYIGETYYYHICNKNVVLDLKKFAIASG